MGGGASFLVDNLLAQGFQCLTVLDIAAPVLAQTQARLGKQAEQVTWLTADITQAALPAARYAVWHDRALFHFLTDPAERRAYVQVVRHALKPQGQIIIATFAPDGPLRCSNLEVVRHSTDSLQQELGDSFTLRETFRETHQTPFNTQQQFVYGRWQRTA